MSTCSLVIVGRPRAGKTALSQLIQTPHSVFQADYPRTKGFTSLVKKQNEHTLTIYDTAGKWRKTNGLLPEFIKQAGLILYCFNLGDNSSLEEDLEAIRYYQKLNSEARFLLVGTQLDEISDERKNSYFELQKSIKVSAAFMLSVKTKEGLSFGLTIIEHYINTHFNATTPKINTRPEANQEARFPWFTLLLKNLTNTQQFSSLSELQRDSIMAAADEFLDALAAAEDSDEYNEAIDVFEASWKRCLEEDSASYKNVGKVVASIAAAVAVVLLVTTVGFACGFVLGLWAGPMAFLSAIAAGSAAANTIVGTGVGLGLLTGGLTLFGLFKESPEVTTLYQMSKEARDQGFNCTV